MQHKSLTLFELNSLVRGVIESSMDQSYWVQAELSEAREWGGHCYMDLIQKDERSNTPVARAQARCWRSNWMVLKRQFEQTTGQTFHAGLKVLLLVHASFHENYGFAWIVDDIDAAYTMGDMARKRQEIIRQLKAEGVFELQKELELPLFCQRIAVVSSQNAAGYGDFCNQLEQNDYDLKFYTQLFPAVMQGEQTERSIISALNAINSSIDLFDCVVIIRGGGATSDLSGFDTLALAENVANFPLPIITGIGHERDESVLDMVSHTRVKTPTAAAAFLIDHLASVLECIEDAQQHIVTYISQRMETELMRLDKLSAQIPVLFSLVRTRQDARLDRLSSRLNSSIERRLEQALHHVDILATAIQPSLERRIMRERHRLEMLAQRAHSLDPQLMLARGYSITLKDGHAVRDAKALKQGDVITTRLENGSIKSRVVE